MICTYKVNKESTYYTKVNVTVLTYLIPTFLLVVINCIIITQMMKFIRRRKNLLSAQSVRGSRHQNNLDQSDSRTEMKRVIAYLLISFMSFAFTLPYTVTVCVRAGHTTRTPRCESSIVAELSRLFNSIKDIQYACHGYTYIFFFKFFRKRLKQMSSKVKEKCCCANENNCIKMQTSRWSTEILVPVLNDFILIHVIHLKQRICIYFPNI